MTVANLTEYIIKENDTLQMIAKDYLNNSNQWIQIALYNDLEYPYIADIAPAIHAEGYVQMYRNPAVITDITIPVGTIVKSIDVNGVERTFEVMGSSDYMMYAGVNKLEIPVISIGTGRPSEAKKLTVTSIVGLSDISSVINLEDLSVFKNKTRATGVVTFYRGTDVVGDLLIPYGTEITTTYNVNTRMSVRRYYVAQETVLLSANTSIDVPVICTEYGEVGNVPPYMINSLSSSIISANFLKVQNLQSFIDGKITNVKYIGETIFIPQLTTTSSTPKSERREDLYATLLGEDLRLTESNDLAIDLKGDLMSVVGVDNLSQTIRDLVKSELGYSLTYHPEYGSLVSSFIGDAVDDETIQLIKEELLRTIKYDPRVAGVRNFNVLFDSGVFLVELDIIVAGIDNVVSIAFTV